MQVDYRKEPTIMNFEELYALAWNYTSRIYDDLTLANFEKTIDSFSLDSYVFVELRDRFDLDVYNLTHPQSLNQPNSLQ